MMEAGILDQCSSCPLISAMLPVDHCVRCFFTLSTHLFLCLSLLFPDTVVRKGLSKTRSVKRVE